MMIKVTAYKGVCVQMPRKTVKTIEFNVNNYIMAKLNDRGYAHWVMRHNERLPERYMITESQARSKADAEGYVKFQMWEFMKYFGHTLSLGCELMFDA